MRVANIRLSDADFRDFTRDKELYGNGYISIARGGDVGRRLDPVDVQIKMYAPKPKPEAEDDGRVTPLMQPR